MVNIKSSRDNASAINMACIQLDDQSLQAVLDVLKSGQLTQGPKVEEFEKKFADYIGTKYAIAMSSGTAALHVGLLAAGISVGDEVITTPFSFIASANCCLFCGAKPVFVDINDETFNITPHLIEEKICTKTKAIIIVHLYGQPCDMDEILEICKKYDLVLIEDACQAHGAEYAGRKVGSFGIGCFSFYSTKNMITGEGGMITTEDEDIARRARLIRHHGQSQRDVNDLLGYNYRMTDIAAALGICQLKNLDSANAKRIRNARYFSEHITQIRGLFPPYIAPNRKHVFHQYTIKITDDYELSRDKLQERLIDKRIGTAVYYPTPIHQQPLYRNLGYNGSLPASEAVAKRVLSLPVHPYLDDTELEIIVEALSGP